MGINLSERVGTSGSWKEDTLSTGSWMSYSDSLSDWITQSQILTATNRQSRVSLRDQITQLIRNSAQLEGGWDGEEAIATDARAIIAAIEAANDLWQMLANRGAGITLPAVTACVDGSIDLYWNKQDYRLLINFGPDGRSEFSGKNSTGLKMSGSTISNLHSIADWLAVG